MGDRWSGRWPTPVPVLDGNKKVHGKTKLSNLRATYTKPD